ncbi:MAG: hypothetical protein MZV49_08290 [Rhodopseudomonas palustris]|nr:hypothetical protein [Rhodopseudomonas palustris]
MLPYCDRHRHRAMLTRASRLVSAVTGVPGPVQQGDRRRGTRFAHESGIHQDGMLKNAQTYEIMTAGDGRRRRQTSLVMGKHSGRHAFIAQAGGAGLRTRRRTQLDDAFARFKALADRKKDIYDEDIEALVDRRDRARARSHHACSR